MIDEFEVDVPLGRLHGLRRRRAQGPRVIALHGWLDNAASFVPLIQHLPDIDVVALDLPGHGHSPHLPVGADYTFTGYLQTVLDVADALGWDRFSLLGHSMGGGVCTLLAAACPDRVRRLAVVEMLGIVARAPETTGRQLTEAVAAWRRLGRKRQRVFATIDEAIEARVRANGITRTSARLLVERGLREADGGWTWNSDPRLTLPTMIGMTEAQVQDIIGGIQCRAQVIFADPAPTYLPDALRRQRAARLAHGRLTLLPGNHFIHLEDPAAVAGILGEFFAD